MLIYYNIRRPPWGPQAARSSEFASSLEVLVWWLDGFQSCTLQSLSLIANSSLVSCKLVR